MFLLQSSASKKSLDRSQAEFVTTISNIGMLCKRKHLKYWQSENAKYHQKLLEYIWRQEKRDNWWNQMFMSSNDGPRPSLCCRTPVCLFSAWKVTKSCDFIQEIQQCIFHPPDRDAWRQDTEESLVVSSNCFFLGPFSTIPPPPMVLCPLAVFPEEAGQGRLQGQDSSSWTRSSSCSTRWSSPRGRAAPSLPHRQARQWTRSRRWNRRADVERILFLKFFRHLHTSLRSSVHSPLKHRVLNCWSPHDRLNIIFVFSLHCNQRLNLLLNLLHEHFQSTRILIKHSYMQFLLCPLSIKQAASYIEA